MKNFYLSLMLIVGTILSSCSQQDILLDEADLAVAVAKNKNQISLEKAYSIAWETVGKNTTRSGVPALAKVDYVLNQRKTRAQEFPDTLAYVINYGNDCGFAVISADNRIEPVLAFSETGHFSLENDLVAKAFTDNIGTYLSENIENEPMSDGIPYFVVKVSPKICTQVGQKAPFNAYVDKEHPGCAVGCVPVALSLALMNTQDQLTYHNRIFDFKKNSKYHARFLLSALPRA